VPLKRYKYMDKKEKVKYLYDFPDQREIAKTLLIDDKQIIAERTGYSINTVIAWCKSTRKNVDIETLAKHLSEINTKCRIIKESSTAQQ
jgi:hypothetical protein